MSLPRRDLGENLEADDQVSPAPAVQSRHAQAVQHHLAAGADGAGGEALRDHRAVQVRDVHLQAFPRLGLGDPAGPVQVVASPVEVPVRSLPQRELQRRVQPSCPELHSCAGLPPGFDFDGVDVRGRGAERGQALRLGGRHSQPFRAPCVQLFQRAGELPAVHLPALRPRPPHC